MNLSAPKNVTWIVAVIAGVLGLLGHFMSIPFATANSFWLLAIGFVLLALATWMEGL